MQDKLIQVKDTRAALDAMREDHKAALQQEAVFAEQQRQIQLAMKLDVLRQRKQQYQQVIFFFKTCIYLFILIMGQTRKRRHC